MFKQRQGKLKTHNSLTHSPFTLLLALEVTCVSLLLSGVGGSMYNRVHLQLSPTPYLVTSHW